MAQYKGLGTVFSLIKDGVTLVVDSLGAKVLAIEVADTNILFYDESDIKHSGIPICLPYFGPLRGGSFEVEGKTYEMGQHGFFRDSDFSVETTDDSIICRLESTEKTLSFYPYAFSFEAKYTIVDKGVTMSFTLLNKDTKELAIAPGFHPYFAVDAPDNVYFTTKAVDGNDSLQDFKTVGLEESGVFKIASDNDGVKRLHVINAPDMHLLNHGLNSTIITPGNLPEIELIANMDQLNRMTIWRDNDSSSSICVEPAYEENAIQKGRAIILQANETFSTDITIRHN